MKIDTQHRRWIVTLKHADCPTAAELRQRLDGYEWIGQLEKGGKTDYLHWQIAIDNPTGIRFSTLKNLLPTAHLEPASGTPWEGFCYVTKIDTRATLDDCPGIDEIQVRSAGYEVPPERHTGGNNTPLKRGLAEIEAGMTPSEYLLIDPAAATVMKSLREYHAVVVNERFGRTLRDVEVHYYFGKPGTGKTYSVYDEYGMDKVYRVPNYKTPFDTYESSHDVLVLDEFAGQIELPMLNQICDKYPLLLPARYNDRQACFTKVIMISNAPLTSFYKAEQRRYPDLFAALLRRIHVVREFVMDDDGNRSTIDHVPLTLDTRPVMPTIPGTV